MLMFSGSYHYKGRCVNVGPNASDRQLQQCRGTYRANYKRDRPSYHRVENTTKSQGKCITLKSFTKFTFLARLFEEYRELLQSPRRRCRRCTG